MLRTASVMMAALLLACGALSAQSAPAERSAAEEAVRPWSISASAYTYITPEDQDYVQPTITFDRDELHLELRYNYEDLETASAWAGYNLEFGDKVALELTPMLGGVFGDTTGLAVGYKGTLSWWRLALYGEGEYLHDLGDAADNFFYSWTELALSAPDWLRYGLVAQRTRVYDTDVDIQRGFLVGIALEHLDLATYVFNVDESEPTVVLAVTIGF